MKVNVLGTEYEIIFKNYEDEPYFEKHNADAFCDSLLHQIVVCKLETHPDWQDETTDYIKKYYPQVLRHELIHAFLNESGLQANSGIINNIGWAKNEEMVDFFAIQYPKIKKLFEELQIG